MQLPLQKLVSGEGGCKVHVMSAGHCKKSLLGLDSRLLCFQALGISSVYKMFPLFSVLRLLGFFFIIIILIFKLLCHLIHQPSAHNLPLAPHHPCKSICTEQRLAFKNGVIFCHLYENLSQQYLILHETEFQIQPQEKEAVLLLMRKCHFPGL